MPICNDGIIPSDSRLHTETAMHRFTRWMNIGALGATAFVFAATAQAQKAASVCKDGTTTTTTGRGTCSGHGGVDKAASKAAAKTVKREVKAATAVTKRAAGTKVTTVCEDGTTSSATGRGACSGHGGVKGAEVTSKTTGRAIPVPSTSVTPRNSKPTAPMSKRSTAATSGNGSAEDHNPSGAVAQCKDGMYSHAVNHQGACGHHGGVARWM